MTCPSCASGTTHEQARRTTLGYRTFRCPSCRRAFNFLEFPTDIVLLAVRWRLRYKLSLRDLAEMLLERGFVFTHEAVREWEARFAPLLADCLRAHRRGRAGASWSVDETYVPGQGPALPLSGDRSGRQPGRHHAQRHPRHGRGAALLSRGPCQ
jgi:hypothetical protein